jgi:hypothetical protein
MRHAEMLRRFQANEADYRAITKGSPEQEEKLGEGVDLLWSFHATIGHGKDEVGYRLVLKFGCERELTAARARRYAEVRDALDAWERNEGDWPLAKGVIP